MKTVSDIVTVTTDSEGPVPGASTLVSGLIVVSTAAVELVALGISPPVSPPPVAPIASVELVPLKITVEVIGTAGAEDDALKEATIDEEIAGTSVTGQTVVVMSTTLVTSIVDTAPGGNEVSAAVSEAAGQLVTVAAHEIIVETDVTLIVNVVKGTPAPTFEVALANGGARPLLVVLVNGGVPVTVGMPVPTVEVVLMIAFGSEIVASFL